MFLSLNGFFCLCATGFILYFFRSVSSPVFQVNRPTTALSGPKASEIIYSSPARVWMTEPWYGQLSMQSILSERVSKKFFLRLEKPIFIHDCSSTKQKLESK